MEDGALKLVQIAAGSPKVDQQTDYVFSSGSERLKKRGLEHARDHGLDGALVQESAGAHSPISSRPSIDASAKIYCSEAKTSDFFFTFWTTDNDMAPRFHRSVESVLFHHPGAQVVVYSNSLAPDTFHSLQSGGCDISVAPIELKEWAHGTPLEEWTDRLDEWKTGEYFYAHLADAMRLAVLAKEGGTYFDTDIIFVNPVTSLHNAVGLQETTDRAIAEQTEDHGDVLCNAVMKFERHNPYIEACVREFADAYDPSSWDYNGPQLLTRVWQSRFFGNPKIVDTLDRSKLYLLDWEDIPKFFQASTPKFVDHDMANLQDNVFVVHLWNKMTVSKAVEDGSLLRRIMDDYCLVCDDGI